MSPVCVRVRLGEEHYALPVASVFEVSEVGDYVPVPGAPPAVLGVLNVRGQVVPVVDPAPLLGAARVGERPRVVLAEDKGRRAALAVDQIVSVGELPEFAEQVESSFLAAAAMIDDKLVGLIELDAVLDAATARKPG